MMNSTVPLLITCDLELAPNHNVEEQRVILNRLKSEFASLGIPVTFFVTTDALAAFAPEVRMLLDAGHDIGLHGLTHAAEEDFRTFSADEAGRLIRKADRIFAETVAFKPQSFRGPRMTTSAQTHRALADCGYRADFSCCPQRLDFVTASAYDPGWLLAPRRPYFSSSASPFRRGKGPIFMVPLSGFGVPFVSGLLYLFGGMFMRLFFNLLLAEARAAGGPIVYLFHSYEFCSRSQSGSQKKLHELYTDDRARRFVMHGELVRRMAAARRVRCMTARHFIEIFGGRP